ncbi:MAG: protein-L-isoaspartate(D-aspartate) O-methyltransferase [Alphaproteobacteria bacterium]|nr:protein-L-isoaspartate(D-aspartate) O-methyltransferase [Alphaproteobacteria bacterium]
MNSEPRQIRLIMELRGEGVIDAAVLGAIERTAREEFVPPQFRDRAYDNTALPIGEGQTISQPLIVGLMTQALEVGPRHKVLEIGTGCGYQAAVLSKLCRRVYSIERHKSLLAETNKRLQRLGYHNITTIAGDGTRGWPEQAPFDRIIVTAAARDDVPQAFLDQLAPGGILVMPLGATTSDQHVWRIRKAADGAITRERLWPVRFVPLIKGTPDSKGRAT